MHFSSTRFDPASDRHSRAMSNFGTPSATMMKGREANRKNWSGMSTVISPNFGTFYIFVWSNRYVRTRRAVLIRIMSSCSEVRDGDLELKAASAPRRPQSLSGCSIVRAPLSGGSTIFDRLVIALQHRFQTVTGHSPYPRLIDLRQSGDLRVDSTR
jgi:hypothetical protein